MLRNCIISCASRVVDMGQGWVTTFVPVIGEIDSKDIVLPLISRVLGADFF